MSYTSNADLEERLGSSVYVQLTDDAGTGVADEDKVAEALGGAEGEVNSYLGRRVAVPVETSGDSQLSAVLKSITLDLAAFRLHGRRPPVPADVRYRYESALQWLQCVASGKAVLPTANEPNGNPALGIVGEVTGSPRVMSREELENL